MIELKPIVESSEDYEAIEKRIKQFFRKELYFPILKEFQLSQATLKNDNDPIAEGLRSGRIIFSKGRFTGKFSAQISKRLREIGAQWDNKERAFVKDISTLSPQIRSAILASDSRFAETLVKIDKRLAAIIPEKLGEKLKIADIFDRIVWKVESKFQKSIKNLSVARDLTEDEVKILTEKWQANLALYIKDFSQEHIKELREKIKENFFKGNRYETMIKTIQKSYDVSANKAKFLARQETNLLMTAFKETRYQSAGIEYYKWRCVIGTPLHPVRPMHQELNDRSQKHGELFRFDTPPVDDSKGGRHNPGQAYNCRCRAVPVFPGELKKTTL